ncbi:MAG TPA: hypothetical protein VHW23_06515 [Kofleriaceae bacterium]|nr:hypothetical protein [Kofleriaceae bacterium]
MGDAECNYLVQCGEIASLAACRASGVFPETSLPTIASLRAAFATVRHAQQEVGVELLHQHGVRAAAGDLADDGRAPHGLDAVREPLGGRERVRAVSTYTGFPA